MLKTVVIAFSLSFGALCPVAGHTLGRMGMWMPG